MGQTVSIRVTSSESGKPLYHSYVINLNGNKTTTTDETGIARLQDVTGDSIRITYVGFRDTVFTVGENINFYEVGLHTQPLETVVIFAEEPFNRKASLGLQEAPMEFLTAVPSLTGDADIMKSITFLPGVSGGREGYSHLFVRGGAQDQNLILYDGATLFNVNHFGGFISMFHSEMIQSVDFYKSYWPSRFGGRLSSVMNIQSARGNFKEHEQSVDIGLIYTKAKAAGPIRKDRISYSVGARRTFIDLITGPLIRKRKKENSSGATNLIVHDINARVDFRIKDNQYLSLSGIHALDRFYYFDAYDYGEDTQYRIRNRALAFNYSNYLDGVTTLRAHASFSDYLHFFDEEKTQKDQIHQRLYPDGVYQFTINNRYTGNSIRSQKIVLTGLSQVASDIQLNYGVDFEALNYSIFLERSESRALLETQTLISSFSDRIEQNRIHTYSVFGDAEYSWNPRWRIKAGIRLPRYANSDYKKWLPEPKLLISLDLTSQSTINASYNLQQQHTQLLGYTEKAGYYREFYTSSDKQIPTSISHQWSIGYFRTFDRLINNLSVELYYKRQRRLAKFLPSIDEDYSVLNYHSLIHLDGTNRSYGIETLLQKTQGNFHGSIAYTYAHSRSSFATLNQGKPFDADFDYRHNVNILLLWKFGAGYTLSGQWTYKSGRPFTIPGSQITRDEFNPRDYPLITEINNYRMPAYHRLDLSLDREWITQKKGKKQWFGISVYNAYNRNNPFYVSPDGKNLKVNGFFPIIPSFHFGFEP